MWGPRTSTIAEPGPPRPRTGHGTTSIPHGSAAGAAIPARPGSSSATASPNSPPASRPPPTSCGVTCRSSTAGTAGKAFRSAPTGSTGAPASISVPRARSCAAPPRSRPQPPQRGPFTEARAAGGGVWDDRRAGGAAGARLAAGGPEGGGGRHTWTRRPLAARETASETAPAAPELAAEIQVTRSSDPTLRAAGGVPGRLPGQYR